MCVCVFLEFVAALLIPNKMFSSSIFSIYCSFCCYFFFSLHSPFSQLFLFFIFMFVFVVAVNLFVKCILFYMIVYKCEAHTHTQAKLRSKNWDVCVCVCVWKLIAMKHTQWTDTDIVQQIVQFLPGCYHFYAASQIMISSDMENQSRTFVFDFILVCVQSASSCSAFCLI